MFPRFAVLSLFCLILPTQIFAKGDDGRTPFMRMLVGEFSIVDENSPLLLREGPDGTHKLLGYEKWEGLKIVESNAPFQYDISYTVDTDSIDLPSDPAFGQLKFTDFDRVEIKSIQFGDLVVTRWSNTHNGLFIDVVLKDGLSFYSLDGKRIRYSLERKPLPRVEGGVANKEKLYANLSLTCSQAAARICENAGDAMELAYCAVPYERECKAFRAQK